MRKISLVVVMTLMAVVCSAQKIQLKKGIISNEDEPIGKLVGKATLLGGTDITLQSLDGASLVKIKDPYVGFQGIYPGIRYYSIQFVPLNKTMSLIPANKVFFTSEKKLVEYLFESIGKNFLNKDGLNAEVVNQGIASNDQSAAIARDTTYTNSLLKMSWDKFKEPVVSRAVSARVRLVSIKKETINNGYSRSTLETFDIVQGDVIIGKIIKLYEGDPSVSNGSATASKSVEYTVMRKVSPFVLDGKEIEFANMTVVKSRLSTPDIETMCERAAYRDLKPSDIFSAEYEIVNWLISRGCL